VAEGRSYRLIARELGLSKNTVLEIVKRNRAMSIKAIRYRAGKTATQITLYQLLEG
jgi:hypothetical protein